MSEKKTNIVKVKYFIHGDLLGIGEYSYYTEDRLNIGDIVTVPVRDTTGKAQVCSVDVPEAEIEAFRDKVKTIPSGAVISKESNYQPVTTDMPHAAVEQAFTPQDEPLVELKVDLLTGSYHGETALSLRPGEDIEAHNYFGEASKMLMYAERRIIKTLDDAKLATNDLSLISKLKKAMEAKRKEKLAPHEAQVKAIRDTYNYLMTPVIEAERITKAKQLSFFQEQERIRSEQETINLMLEQAAQKQKELTGEITEVEKVDVIEVPKRIRTDIGSTGLTDHWVYEVVDFALVPDTYKVINSVLLNAIAKKYHDTTPVSGIKFLNKPYLATR